LPRFLSLLSAQGVTAVADVRSRPYSRRHPHFNRNQLAESLTASGIAYVFLGDLLGPREEIIEEAYRRRAAAAAWKPEAGRPTRGRPSSGR